MDSCIENPVTPCAMTGACAVLCGFEGLCVIVHGSSGCYYYPKSILKVPIYSTNLLESEIVMGTVGRLKEVVRDVSMMNKPIAVLNTCVPALIGDDLASAFDGRDVIFVDAPGFCGDASVGAKKAYEALNIKTDQSRPGVNIDGVSLLDLFWRGNLHEARRVLYEMGVVPAVSFAKDSFENLSRGAAPFSISVNPSLNSDIGNSLGSLLFSDFKKTVENLSDVFGADERGMISEWEVADDRMFYSADKYLRKYNTPDTVVFAQSAYADFSKKMLERYFGADVTVVLREEISDIARIKDILDSHEFDLILGSSFEANLCKSAAFFGITQPDRSRVSISARALSGVEGGVYFIESVLNSLRDREML